MKFIREIPASHLNELIACFTHPVLTKNITVFKISQDTLISYLDSMLAPLSTERKLAVIKDIRNQYHLQKVFEMFLMPKRADHQTLYQMRLIMLQGDTIVAKAYSFSDPYLPWKFKDDRLYDPKLTELYDYMKGNERNESSRRHYFYMSLTFVFLRLHGLVLYPQKQL